METATALLGQTLSMYTESGHVCSFPQLHMDTDNNDDDDVPVLAVIVDVDTSIDDGVMIYIRRPLS